MLKVYHIQRKTVCILPIPHVSSDLTPPCQKKQKLDGKNEIGDVDSVVNNN